MKKYTPVEKYEIGYVEQIAATQLADLKAKGVWQGIIKLKHNAARPDIVPSQEQENTLMLAYFRLLQITSGITVNYPFWRMLLLDNAYQEAEDKGGVWSDYYENYLLLAVEAAEKRSADAAKRKTMD